jgi:site-specific recombinase XerC
MSTTKPHRPSKAAIKAQTSALLAQRAAGASPLPAEYLSWLDRYEPDGIAAQSWLEARPFVRAVLERSHKRGVVDLKKRTSDLAQFAGWLLSRGTVLDPSAVMVRPLVDEYCRVGMPASIAKSRSDRRSRLRIITDQVNPEQAPPKQKSIARPDRRGPYSEQEVAAILRAIGAQPTPLLVRQLAVCVGLGLGAGIDSAELKLLMPSHIVDSADGIRVDVPGKRARTVWVRRELEPVVRRGLAGADPKRPLIGQNQERSNVAAKVFDNATWVGDLPRLDQARLRTTWIAWLMSRPVPLSVICHAAGLGSTRTLFDLLPFLPGTGTPSDLRDGGAR